MTNYIYKSGFTIIDKPQGKTSYGLVSDLGRVLLGGQKNKCGHAGTLDSFASGVLVCLFGRYTRLSDFFMCNNKGYEAEILFGEETDTLDPLGKVIARSGIPSLEKIKSVIPQFCGNIMQAPPAYSAVHINGKRAYERVLNGEDVKPEPRSVNIMKLEIKSFNDSKLSIFVHCSKGTYIRSLARDIALACGERGRLSNLRRVFSGNFTLTEAVKPEDFSESKLRVITPCDAEKLDMATVFLNKSETNAFKNGIQAFRINSIKNLKTNKDCIVFSDSEEFTGIIKYTGNVYKSAFNMGASC